MTRKLNMLRIGALAVWPALWAACQPASADTAAQTPPVSAPAAATTPAAVPAGSVLLRYKFKPGDQHTYKMAMDMTMAVSAAAPAATTPGAVNMNAQTVPMKTHMDMAYRQTVLSVDPGTGNATVQMQFEWMTMLLNGQPMPLPASAMAPMKQPGTMVMSPTGKVVSADLPGAAAAMGGQSPWSSMQSTAVLPDQPVKAGDSWTVSQTLPGMGMSMQVPMILAGIVQRGGHNVARLNMVYNADFKAKPGATAGMPGSQTGSMTGTGIQYFDVDLGLPTNMTMDAHMDSAVAVPARPGAAPTAAPPTAHIVMDMHMVMTLADNAAN